MISFSNIFFTDQYSLLWFLSSINGGILRYRVIKKSLCTWWLQYRNLQVIFKVSPADRQGQGDTRLTLPPSVIPNSNYVIMVSYLNCLKYFFVFLYCNHQVNRLFDHPAYTATLYTVLLWEKELFFNVRKRFFTLYNPLPVIRVSTLNFASSPVTVPDIMCLTSEWRLVFYRQNEQGNYLTSI
jgi:hypothetical protein